MLFFVGLKAQPVSVSPTFDPVYDAAYLARTLQLARLGTTRVLPNPRVGAVIVAQGRIVGEGFHDHVGGPHAEVNAVAAVRAEDRALLREATMYVSLEPCSHHGRTPPCADMIVREGIPRVVIGCQDPNPQVAGRGIDRMRQQGHSVVLSPEPGPFLYLNRGFITNQVLHRPYLTLKWAESPDGYLARMSQGQPLPTPISGQVARVMVHRLRASHHSILVGRRTAAIDNPSLTTRHYPGEDPLRIVFDPHLHLSTSLQLLTDRRPTLLLNRHRHEVVGALQYYVPQQWEDLNLLFAELYEKLGLCSILIEGGQNILQQCLDQGAFDEVIRLQGPRPLRQGVPAPRLPQGWSFDTYRWIGDSYLSERRWRAVGLTRSMG